MWIPCVVSSRRSSGEVSVRVGHELIDEYLHFLAGRARPNSLLANAYDLKVFFTWCGKSPAEVRSSDVVAFVAAQRAPRAERVVRLSDGGSGLSARTVARRLSSLSGLYAYLLARGDAGVTVSPVPRGLATRRSRRNGGRAAPLVRTPRLLPRILEPAEVNALVGALRTSRDRAMVEAMVLGGLRRCEVLGLRLADLSGGPAASVRRRGQGWSSADHPSVVTLVRIGGRLPRRRAALRDEHRAGLRRAEGTASGATLERLRPRPDPRVRPGPGRSGAWLMP